MAKQLQTRAKIAPVQTRSSLLGHDAFQQHQDARDGAAECLGQSAECVHRPLSIQRRATRQTTPSTVPAIVDDVWRSPGQPLDAATRMFMESRFGHNFSQVRVHTDARAAAAAHAVHALAYTVGQDVVFGHEQYAPNTTAGQQLLAHELVHTIQQGGGHRAAGRLVVSEPEQGAEREAEMVSTSLLSAQTPGLMHGSLDAAPGAATTGASPLANFRIQPTFAGHHSILFRQPTEGGEAPTADDTQGQQVQSEAIEGTTDTFEGPCIRTPFGPGEVRFNGCSAAQLQDYAVIPEDATGPDDLRTPVSGAWDGTDGFWFRHHSPKTEWFKIGNHCDVDVTCAATNFSTLTCCNLAASLLRGWPDWTSDSHITRNPF